MSFELVGVQLVAQDAAQFNAAMASADKAVAGFGDQAGNTFRQMPSLSDIAVGALHKIGEVAVSAFLQAGQAAVGFFKDSISAAGDFQQNFAEFGNAVGHTIDGTGLKLDDFKKQFISLGKELPVSTADVEKAAIEMARGGIDPAVIAGEGLRKTIQFASAALKGDLVGAAQISAKTMQAWTKITDDAKTKTDFLTHAQNLMTQATTAASTTVPELFQGLSNVGGVARLLGQDFDQTTIGLAQLTPSFASSADAGTSFAAFLRGLQPHTKPAIEAMQSLGLWTEKGGSAFFDAQGKYVGLAKAQDLLQKATKSLTDEQRAQILQQIFGNDGIRAAAVFAQQGVAGYNALSDSIAKQTTLTEAAKNNQSTYNTAVENFHGSIEALQITIGSVFLPLLTSLFNDYLAPGINTLTTLAGALTGDNDAFSQLSPTMQTVALTLEQVWTDVQAGIGYIQGLVGSFQSVGTESSTLGGVLNDLSGIWKNLLSVFDAVMAGYQSIVEAVLPIVQSFIKDHGTEISDFFQTTWDNIVDIINTALDLYKAIVPPILQAIAQFITAHGTEIEQIITGVWHAISAIIDAALTLIKGVLKTTLQLIQGDWKGAWTTVQETAAQLWADIKQLIQGNLEAITGLFGTTWDNIKSATSSAWEEIKSSVSGGIDGLVKLIEGIPDQVASVGKAIVDSIWNGIRDEWYKLVDWFNNELQKLKDKLPFSEPKDPTSPLRGLQKSGRATVDMFQSGMRQAGPLVTPAMIGTIANPAAMYASGNTTMATYNQQRTVNLAYHTPHAPPASTSLAIANALAY